jgi:hypothetical protein
MIALAICVMVVSFGGSLHHLIGATLHADARAFASSDNLVAYLGLLILFSSALAVMEYTSIILRPVPGPLRPNMNDRT